MERWESHSREEIIRSLSFPWFEKRRHVSCIILFGKHIKILCIRLLNLLSLVLDSSSKHHSKSHKSIRWTRTLFLVPIITSYGSFLSWWSSSTTFRESLSLLKDSERNSRKQMMMMTQTTKTRVINTKVIRTMSQNKTKKRILCFTNISLRFLWNNWWWGQ